MKTNTQTSKRGLKNRAEQLSTPNTGAGTDTRLPIDSEARKKNRSLPTVTVLEMLSQIAPEAYALAEVVGKWVWVQFAETPSADTRQQLSQLGFHWNRDRQAWQHPCGQFSMGSLSDPREKYSTYHPANVKTA